MTGQRGVLRPGDIAAVANANGDDGADIGAFEFQDSIFKDGFGG